MRNFHLTHIAVNLLLIVALAIQPVAVCLANVDCAVGCSNGTAFACQGCGCCEVERANDRCCCCSGPTRIENEENPEEGCCSSKHRADAKSESSTEDTDEKSAIGIASVEDAAGVRSICLCEQDSQPLSDSTPRRPVSENRDTLSLESHDLDEGVWNCGQLLATTQYGEDVPVSVRFSQVILCIWRL
jgi:hypothetical protein